MKRCLIAGAMWVLMHGMASLLVAASIGSPDMAGFALAGVGQTAPTMNNLYPDFVVKGVSNYSYLIFGGDYDKEDDWDGANWLTNVDYLKFKYSTDDDGKWLGFAVGAAGDVTGDGETHRDVLIGDIRYLDICDPDAAYGKTWLIHHIVYTDDQPTITLTATQGIDCYMTEISSDQAQNWFGCAMGWAGNLRDPAMTPAIDDFIVGASLWDDTANSKTDVGRAYVFLGNGNMPTTLSASLNGIAITGENAYDHFGCAVAGRQA